MFNDRRRQEKAWWVCFVIHATHYTHAVAENRQVVIKTCSQKASSGSYTVPFTTYVQREIAMRLPVAEGQGPGAAL